ncbi:alpha/beta-hydrolase [Auriscalpium vulgare]|uniref:Alpha/beta-hydrolase n=1 Tax=Auriscalpium vulgare TaxID=40419 RepID=A0ACB8RKH6_9AGAM|nr:alpha/beta-hydrolase [Auriscalpium vulgare]
MSRLSISLSSRGLRSQRPAARRLVCPQRYLSTRIEPVDLHYDVVPPADGSKTDKPLVILHGLFGMKRNWHSLSKAFSRDLKRPVYALDLRNHGTSPHVEPMTYEAMASDVLHFCEKHSLTNVSLLGHSMGGKVAMAVALSPSLPQDLLAHLIVADIAPSRGSLSSEFQGYVEAMNKIEASRVSSRKEAQEILAPYEDDAMTRAFLLTNIDAKLNPLKFQVPLHIIGPAIRDIGWFPHEPQDATWNGKTLFIKGSKSNYINKNNLPLAKQFFPNMSIEILEAGHWVHAEKPNEFRKMVTDFVTAS